MRLALQLVIYNNQKYLKFLVQSLSNQYMQDWTLFVWDNNSTDKSIQILKTELDKHKINYQIFNSKINIGFAGGHNMLFRKHKAKYVALINPDLYLAKSCLKRCIEFLDNSSNKIIAVSPRLMKWNFEILEKNTQDNKNKNLQSSFTDIIDALGLQKKRSWRIVEYQQGKQWSEVYKKYKNSYAIKVWGISGTLPIYKKKFLENIFEKQSLFDDFYNSYKEDVDLAFCLNSIGYESFVLLNTCAYHDRQTGISRNIMKNLLNKKNNSFIINYYSYRNHLLTLFKNLTFKNFLKDFFYILTYEFSKLFYYLIKSPSIIYKTIIYFFSNFSKIKKSRQIRKKLIQNFRIKNKQLFKL